MVSFNSPRTARGQLLGPGDFLTLNDFSLSKENCRDIRISEILSGGLDLCTVVSSEIKKKKNIGKRNHSRNGAWHYQM